MSNSEERYALEGATRQSGSPAAAFSSSAVSLSYWQQQMRPTQPSLLQAIVRPSMTPLHLRAESCWMLHELQVSMY